MLAFLSAASAFLTDRFEKRNDRGATAVEYGLLVGLIAVVIIGVLVLLGPTLSDMFGAVNTELEDATPTEGA